MSAGPALERDNVAGYNCSYLPVDSLRAFDESLYVLMCGTGVGFSVEEQYVNKIPEVPTVIRETDTRIVVADSKLGWAVGLRQLFSLLYAGSRPKWDLGMLRPAGAILKTFGGRSSGPEPLDNLFQFVCDTVQAAQGRKLTTLECHDIMCKIAECIVVGGVRRSALISLSSLSDERMRSAKYGKYWDVASARGLSNNSAVYLNQPSVGEFIDEWKSLYLSKSGERGIFNRDSAKTQSKSTGRRDIDHAFGTNPCGEIILRPFGFCNLSEVVVRHNDSFASLKRKVEIASIIGTYQSTLTNFRYLRKIWKTNAEEERLLGVSLTGIMDHPLLSGQGEHKYKLQATLEAFKTHAIATNQEWAEKLGITPSVAITTVKPSGTVSQLVDSSSGIHPRHNRFYLRAIRADKKDPLSVFLRGKGFPVEDDITNPNHIDVFYFPQKAPEEAVLREDRTAIEQLEHYLVYKKYWCEHNPSITVYIREPEWIEVASWVYKHFGEIGGIAFLPYDGGHYKQAPYQDLTEEQYNEWVEKMPKDVDWTELREETDLTSGMQELACTAGVCEIN
jgi:ribonucleoside-diphosphate reductase alpha chain